MSCTHEDAVVRIRYEQIYERELLLEIADVLAIATRYVYILPSAPKATNPESSSPRFFLFAFVTR